MNHISFNKPGSHLCCSTDTGFSIYKLSPKIENRRCRDMQSGIGLMNMLDASNIAVMIGGGPKPFRSPDTVVVWDDRKNSSVLELEAKDAVCNCVVIRKAIVVITSKKLRVCSLTDGRPITSKDTFDNPSGLCEIYENKNRLMIVTLGSKLGSVVVWDTSDKSCKTVQAHEHAVCALAVNRDGTMFATSSNSGTNIHLYETATGKLMFKFRRGTLSTLIFSLCFNSDSSMLACCSRNGTVHLFVINKKNTRNGNVKSLLSPLSDYMPIPDYFNSQWSSQQISLTDTSRAVCSFDSDDVLHIATYNGSYYRISKTVGGMYNSVSKSVLSSDK